MTNNEVELSQKEVTNLKKMIETMRADVKKTRKTNTEATTRSTMYPPVVASTLVKDIGVILDSKFTVTDLFNVGKITPPNNLYWIQLKYYLEFKKFLDSRGIPAYISFAGCLEADPKSSLIKYEDAKDGYNCAKLLIEASQNQGLEKLPLCECHSPVVTKKQQIELLLLDYKLKKKTNKKAK